MKKGRKGHKKEGRKGQCEGRTTCEGRTMHEGRKGGVGTTEDATHGCMLLVLLLKEGLHEGGEDFYERTT
jgi:hypothetical protein